MLQDLRFALRQLMKSPGFTIVAVLTLALAIGSTTPIFSAVDAVLLHPLPYPDPDQPVILGQNIRHYGLAKIASTPFEFVTFRKMATCFSQIAAVRGLGSVTLAGRGEPESVAGAAVTANVFSMLDSSLPVATQTMQQALDDSLVRLRFSLQLMTAFAVVAALLAAMGIYGVLASLVDRRRREIGIRMALGARPDVLALVLRQGSLPVALGLAPGVSGAVGLTRILSSLPYEVSATDPLTFT